MLAKEPSNAHMNIKHACLRAIMFKKSCILELSQDKNKNFFFLETKNIKFRNF